MSRLQKIVLSVLSIVLIALLALTVFSGKGISQPDENFIKPEFDSMAVEGPPNSIPDELRYREAKLNEDFSVGISSNLMVDDENNVEIYLASSSTNKGYVRVILYDESGRVLGSTGALKPNQYVKNITLDVVPEQNQVVIAKVLTYEKDTYYSLGSVNIKLDLSV